MSSEQQRSLIQRTLRHNLLLGHGKNVPLAAWMLLAIAAGFLAYVARVHEITHDMFHEMSLFREALVLGDFPQEDVFAYTPTVSPSVHHEWATGAVLYFATLGTGLGLAGLPILKLSLSLALWLLLYRVARMRGAHPYIFALIAFFCFPVFWVGFATIRAQLFTLVFVAAQLWMQELDWRGRKSWILLWLVMLVAWLNIHAGFVVGLGLITFHSVEKLLASWITSRSWLRLWRDNWHLFVAAPVAAAAVLINPYGWQFVPYLVRAIGMDRPEIAEWKPLWLTHDPVGTISMFVICLAFVVYAVRVLPIQRMRGAAFLALTAYMTLKHIRHGSIFGVVWLAYVPAWISRTKLGKNLVQTIDHHSTQVTRVCQGVAAACLLFSAYHHVWRPSLPPQPLYSSASYPSQAIRYLRNEGFKGNLMTPFHAGAYVSWELYPHVKVSFDGRYEVAYQPEIMPEHTAFYDAEEGWEQLLDKYPTDAVLVHRDAEVWDTLVTLRDKGEDEGKDEEEALDVLRDWKLVYRDPAYLIVARRDSQLTFEDHANEALKDEAWEAFTPAHSHWARQRRAVYAQSSVSTVDDARRLKPIPH